MNSEHSRSSETPETNKLENKRIVVAMCSKFRLLGQYIRYLGCTVEAQQSSFFFLLLPCGSEIHSHLRCGLSYAQAEESYITKLISAIDRF